MGIPESNFNPQSRDCGEQSIQELSRGSPQQNPMEANNHNESNIQHQEGNADGPAMDSEKCVLRPNMPHPCLEFPPLYFALEWFPGLRERIKAFYGWRERVSYPLQKRVRGSQFLRYFRIHLTNGEILLLIPLILLSAVCLYQTFIVPSIVGTGKAARLAVVAALLFAQKNSYITMILGLPFDRAVLYHKLFGQMATFTGILHAITYLWQQQQHTVKDISFSHKSRSHSASNNYSYARDAIESIWSKDLAKDSMTTSGTLILLFMLGMYLTSIPIIRKSFFEVFYFIHMILLLCIVGGTAAHTGLMVPLIVAGTTGLDLFMRKIVMARYKYPRKANLKIISETVLQVDFPKVEGFDYNPGQYVYVAVPELSSFEWHPFSLSSAPHQMVVTMHIRVAGSWTGALHKLAFQKSEVSILLDGPYGNFCVDVTSENRYKIVLLFSGGIGLTPMQSMFSELLHEHCSGLRSLKKLKFVWVQRDPELMVQSQVADVSTSIHIVEEDKQYKIRQDKVTRNDFVSLASRILSNAPPSHETDEDLEDLYKSTELSLDVKKDGSNKDAEDGISTTKLEHPSREKSICIDENLGEEGASTPRQENSDVKANDLIEREEGLSGASFGDVVDIDIHLTGVDNDAQNSYSGLIPGLKKGRPNIVALFTEIRNVAIRLKEKRVAVCVCAPKCLSHLAREACIVLSDKEVRFDYHEETFG
ncbi:hypothetical protein ACA910_020640 [Epithemia clementina (nom. ined.)]